MPRRASHARALAVARIALHLIAAVAAVALFGVTVSFLGFVALVGTVSTLLVGYANPLVPFAVGGTGLLIIGTAAAALAVATRRADRWLVRVARAPDPIDVAKEQYVAGEVDEDGLDERVERALASERDENSKTRGRGTSDRREYAGSGGDTAQERA